ncbi:DUF4391 domain-containing protein [Atopobiaceae bacterium LCP21S3_F11]
MLGLPSTTGVGRRIPKEAFYNHLKVNAALRQSFIDDVERFTIANSIKTATTGIPDGVDVHEVLVVEITLKSRKVPEEVLVCVARANPHKLLFVCTHGDEACLAAMPGKLVVGEWRDAEGLTLSLNAANMDKVWDSLASQVAFGDVGAEGATVEERLAKATKLKALCEERDKTEARCRKECQFTRKNELFRQMRALERQIEEMERDETAS